jgi:hypothetical protein
VTADSSLWSTLIDLNKAADALIDRARKRIEPSPPVSRELLTNASVEVRFDRLPALYNPASAVNTNSDALWGNNVKRGIWTNGAARLYLREIAFDTYFVRTGTDERLPADSTVEANVTPPYFRWNFLTSITQKQYADKRVSMFAGGRREAGNHLSFRDPLVIEPMETLTFETELLSFGGSVQLAPLTSFVVGFYLSGYREGM